MKLLLDEDVPVQLLEPLRNLLPGHQVDHVDGLSWKGKKDRHLLPDAAQRGYDALLTGDNGQLDNVDKSRAIRDSRMHHIRFRQDTGRRGGGLDGLAYAMGAVIAGIRHIVSDLDDADGQRLVLIHSIAVRKRHDVVDPRTHPPPYWPSRAGQPTRRRRASADTQGRDGAPDP